MKPEWRSRWSGPSDFSGPFSKHGKVQGPEAPPAHLSIILDASPWGLGGPLGHRQSRPLLEHVS